MRDFDIVEIMNELGKERQAFFSEADFQFAMALVIKRLYSKAEVRLEYVPADIDQQMHIDILVILDKKWIPIELKYKTKKCELKIYDVKYELKEHGAKDQNCYRYLKDIQRIETIKENKKDCFQKGYAIFLTNDGGYQKPPHDNCKYKEFSLEEGIEKKGELRWANGTSDGTKKGCEDPIKLSGTYNIKWKKYQDNSKSETSVFYYLLNEIKK